MSLTLVVGHYLAVVLFSWCFFGAHVNDVPGLRTLTDVYLLQMALDLSRYTSRDFEIERSVPLSLARADDLSCDGMAHDFGGKV